MIRTRATLSRTSLRHDGVAGVVLGVESVPDGLAGGLLAGVNPVYGLYAYLVGTFTGALTTSSTFMAVQATGAMAILIANVDAIDRADDPARALFTLSATTGVVMVLAGAFRLGSVLRFVSNAVMVGFINAVGVNIVVGQLGNFTGYDGQGDNRVARALDTLLHPGRFDAGTGTGESQAPLKSLANNGIAGPQVYDALVGATPKHHRIRLATRIATPRTPNPPPDPTTPPPHAHQPDRHRRPPRQRDSRNPLANFKPSTHPQRSP